MGNIEQLVTSSVKDGIKSYFEDKINIFIIPQIVWIAELYFLMLNSMIEICKLFPVESSINKSIEKFPQEFYTYNNTIHSYMSVWMPFIGFISIALLISGVIISLVNYIPVVKDYGSIWTYANYGISSFFWFGLISLT